MVKIKPKHIIISVVYLASIAALAFPSLIGIFTKGVLLSVLGGIGMLGMSGAYGAYIYLSLNSQNELPELMMNNESEYDKYKSIANWVTSFVYLDKVSYANSSYRNPFKYSNSANSIGKRLKESIDNILIKYDQTIHILQESFNPSDLTYQNYISVLDNVLSVSTSYAKSIKKRLDVFDYRAYSNDSEDSQCIKYMGEIDDKIKQLDDIGDKFDNLLHELVCLDEISTTPLTELQKLIETTSDYKPIDD